MTSINGNAVAALITKPQPIGERGAVQGRVSITKEVVAVGTGNLTLNDVIRVCPLNWDAKIHSLRLFSDDLDTNGAPTITIDVGVGELDLKTGTFSVKDADCFAAGSTVAQAGGDVELALSLAAARNDPNRTVAEVAGYTTGAPNTVPILILTVATAAATAAAGDIGVVISYT